MKTKTSLFLVAIAAAGLFAFPSVLATFAGSHTMETPTSGGRSLDCTKCHQYIVTELNATTMAGKTLAGHKVAANQIGYMNYMYYGEPSSYNSTVITLTDTNTTPSTYSGTTFIKKGIAQSDGLVHGVVTGGLYIINNTGTYSINASWTDVRYVNSMSGGADYPEFYRANVVIAPSSAFKKVEDRGVDYDKSGAVSDEEVCKLCHWRGYFGVEGTHTGMTVVGCTNPSCHGNAQIPGKAFDYFAGKDGAGGIIGEAKHLGAGYQLGRDQEAHSNFYYTMNATNSTYVTADGKTAVRQSLTADYYTCLGCHTHVGMKLSIKRPAGYDVSLDKSSATLADYQNSTGAWLESLEINHTATNFGSAVNGQNVSDASLNTSDITIIKDPTSAWMNDIPGKENQWQNK